MPAFPSPILALTFVFLGGGVGSVLRYLVAGIDHHLNQLGNQLGTRHDFPYGTLIVNLVGCGLIGLGFAWLQAARVADDAREPWRLLLLIGVLGGFTTFSSFGLEAARLLHDGHHARALIYVLASNLGGILLAWGLWRLGTHWWVPQPSV